MRKSKSAKFRSVFISHASANIGVARQVEASLRAAGHEVWLDDSHIRAGVLLREELQQAITASDLVVLLWSKPAAASRWVAAEILSSFHLDRFLIPCVLSPADLPQFLSHGVFCNLRRDRAAALDRLHRQVQEAPRSRNEFHAVAPYESPELGESIQRLSTKQTEIVMTPDPKAALRLQRALDPEMHRAEKRWRFDPTILNLAGYHRKNAYMFKHWDEYCAGRFPADPLLDEAERFFYETLFVNPVDVSALNGLGNVLSFQGELRAALFFVERALEWSAKQGIRYEFAESDRALILSRMGTAPGRARKARA